MDPHRGQEDGAKTRRATILAHLEQHPGPVVLICDHAPRTSAARAVRLDECLGRVDAYRLVDLALAAGSVEIEVGSCRRASARADLHELCELVGAPRLRLAQVASGPSGRLLDESHPPLGRRAALGLSIPRSEVQARHREDGDPAMWLLESLSAAGVQHPEMAAPGLTLSSSGCTACGVCTLACPHGALTLQHRSSTSTLVHSPELCRGEKDCVAHCPVDALRVEGHVDWGTSLQAVPTVLSSVPTVACRKCRARFADDGDELCPQCLARSRDPFGIHLPPEALERLGRGPDGRRLPPTSQPPKTDHHEEN